MVKKFKEQLRRQQINHADKIVEKTQQLVLLRRKDFLKDHKKASIRQNKQLPKISTTNIHQFLQSTSQLSFVPQKGQQGSLQIQRQVHAYKVALNNAEKILEKLKDMGIKNQRPSDYLVEMYKSDKQMLKVRRYLTQKEQTLKEKMQGKDWASKTKRKERAKKKAQTKRQRKKAKLQAKRPKTKIMKVNGKNKIKKR